MFSAFFECSYLIQNGKLTCDLTDCCANKLWSNFVIRIDTMLNVGHFAREFNLGLHLEVTFTSNACIEKNECNLFLRKFWIRYNFANISFRSLHKRVYSFQANRDGNFIV